MPIIELPMINNPWEEKQLACAIHHLHFDNFTPNFQVHGTHMSSPPPPLPPPPSPSPASSSQQWLPSNTHIIKRQRGMLLVPLALLAQWLRAVFESNNYSFLVATLAGSHIPVSAKYYKDVNGQTQIVTTPVTNSLCTKE